MASKFKTQDYYNILKEAIPSITHSEPGAINDKKLFIFYSFLQAMETNASSCIIDCKNKIARNGS